MKQYVIRKYVMAKNVKDALRKDKTTNADEAWIDEDWKKVHAEICEDTIKGFKNSK